MTAVVCSDDESVARTPSSGVFGGGIVWVSTEKSGGVRCRGSAGSRCSPSGKGCKRRGPKDGGDGEGKA